MEIIPVTGDLSVEYSPEIWRLVHIQNLEIPVRPLVIANGAGVVFEQTYAAQVQLDPATLRVNRIAWVSLDWDVAHSQWRMGLMLYDSAMQPTNAHTVLAWPPDAEYRYAEDAWKASDGLAGILGVPLRVNAAEQVAEVAHITEAESSYAPPEENPYTPPYLETRISQPTELLIQKAPQVVKLQPLPIEMGRWILRVGGSSLRWEATQSWQFTYALRTLFFIGAFVVFIVLGIGSRTSGLAPVTPEWLPLMAFGIGAVLAYSALENLWSMLTPSRVVFDDLKREIRRERALTGIVEWRIPYESVEFVLVSQEKARSQGRRSSKEPMLISQDVWVHISAKGDFYLVGELDNVTGKSLEWEAIRDREPSEQRYSLNLDEYDTSVHHAVQHLAEKLSVNAFVDLR